MVLNSSWLSWCREYKKSSYGESLELTHKLFLFEIKHSTPKNLIIPNIAKKRDLKTETIEKHIIQLIVRGLIKVDYLIDLDRKNIILNILKEDREITKLSEIKNLIDDSFYWFEIKIVIASLGVEA